MGSTGTASSTGHSNVLSGRASERERTANDPQQVLHANVSRFLIVFWSTLRKSVTGRYRTTAVKKTASTEDSVSKGLWIAPGSGSSKRHPLPGSY